MEVTPQSSSVIIGETITLNFDLFGKADLIVDVFDDPLCGLLIKANPRPETSNISTRQCVTKKSDLRHRQLVADRGMSNRKPRWTIATSRRLYLGPDKHTTYSITGYTAILSDGAVKVRFADDVFFSFCGEALVTLSLRPHYNRLFSSGEGGFGDHLLFRYMDSPEGPTIYIEPVNMDVGYDAVRKWGRFSRLRGCTNY